MRSKKYTIFYTILLTIAVGLWSFGAMAQDLDVLLGSLQNEKSADKRSQLAYQIALQYQQQRGYKKAVEYFRQAMQGANTAQQVRCLQQIMAAQAAQPNYTAALQTADELLPLVNTPDNSAVWVKVQNQVAEFAQQQKNYERAIQANQALVKFYTNKENLVEVARIDNNLGVLHRRMNKNTEAVAYFNKALATNKNILNTPNKSVKQEIFTYINTGVTLLQLNKNKEADEYFEKAVALADKSTDNYTKASAYNYLAMSDYLADRNGEALLYAKQAQSIAETNNDSENRLAAYKILALINESEDNYKDAQAFNKMYQELLSSVEKQQQQAIQQNLEAEILVEKKENELKSLLAEKQKQEAALKQSELERQKQEQNLKLKDQELALLKRNEELKNAELRSQQLEKQRVQQLLELTRQKAETEKQKLLVQTQQQEAQRLSLIAEKERTEKESSQKALELAETQKQLETEKVAKGKQISYLLMGIGAVILISLLFVVRSLRQTRKLNAKLAERSQKIQQQNIALQSQQEEINTQNEELQQQQEEIMAQRDLVQAINEELSKKNQNLTDSITYASRIQRGMLPPLPQIKANLPDSFVLFKPRDIVSGDFYWFAETQNGILIAAADCTGHGVPGAFMSMICSALLDSIVYEKHIISPEKVLQRLSAEVIATLDQKNNNTHDGMDIVLLGVSPDKKTVQYAGAKNPLFYVHGGECHEIKADKFPVGDFYYPDDRTFTLHNIAVTQTTVFYGFSDGYADQFGGADNRKFGKKQLRELLVNIHTSPMEEQKNILDNTLQAWMEQSYEDQIDDVLVIGFKISV